MRGRLFPVEAVIALGAPRVARKPDLLEILAGSSPQALRVAIMS
jgi:hypothetical protein